MLKDDRLFVPAATDNKLMKLCRQYSSALTCTSFVLCTFDDASTCTKQMNPPVLTGLLQIFLFIASCLTGKTFSWYPHHCKLLVVSFVTNPTGCTHSLGHMSHADWNALMDYLWYCCGNRNGMSS